MDLVRIILAIVLLSSPLKGGEAIPLNGLSFGYYSKSCPQVEKIVRDAMNSIVKSDPKSPAALLRLLFHDCQVGVRI